MDSDYKLHIKLGPSIEFNGEGPEQSVREDYDQFLKALPTLQAAIQPTLTSQYAQAEKPTERAAGVDDALLQKAFLRDGDIVSLRHLPPSDRTNRNADAAILALYGFKKVLGQDDVPVTKLNEALRRSGITMERIDRFITAHMHLYRKGGQRSGGRYSLNNQGEIVAEDWLKQWFN
jgi:hypothetical protein